MPGQLDPQAGRHADVQAGERLVEQQHVGMLRERPGDRDPLGLAAGELLGTTAGELSDPQPVKPLQSGGAGLGARDAARAEPERDVLQGGEVGEQHLVLEDHADPTLPHRQRAKFAAVQPDRALGGDQAGDRAQQRGLAGAVRPDHGEHLAGLGGERHRDPAGHRDVDLQAAHVVPTPSQRSRSANRTLTDTSSITRLSASAASVSAWRVT